MKGYRWSLSIVLVLALGLCGLSTSSQAGVLYGEDYFLLFVGAASLEAGIDRTTAGSWPENFYYKGKLAFYLEGYVLGDVFIEMLVDTENPALLDVVDIDPYEYYPVYGDGSMVNKDTAQHGRLYVALRRDDSSGRYGRSQVHLELGEFLQFDQELRGAYVDLVEEGYELKAVYGHTLSQRIREEYPKTARLPDDQRDWELFLDITGPFYLEQTPVLANSERIYVEVRSPRNPNLVLERQRLAPDHYSIDYATGRLEIQKYISWFDEQGRPVTLVVEYEHVEPIPTSVPLQGVLGGLDVGDMLRVDAGHLRQGEERRVTTLRASFTPTDALEFTGQWAQDGVSKEQARAVGIDFKAEHWQAHAVLQFVDEEFVGFDYAGPGQTRYAFGTSGGWDAFDLLASVNHQRGPLEQGSASDADVTVASLTGSYQHWSGMAVTVRGQAEQLTERTDGQVTKDQTVQSAALETALPFGEVMVQTTNQVVLEQNKLHSDDATRSFLHGGELIWPYESPDPFQVRTGFQWEQTSTTTGTPLTKGTTLGAGVTYQITPEVKASLDAETRRNQDLLQSTEDTKTQYRLAVAARLNDLWQGTIEQGLEIVTDAQGATDRASITRAKLSGELLDQLHVDLYGRYRFLLATDEGSQPQTILGYRVSYGVSERTTASVTQEWSMDQQQKEKNHLELHWEVNPLLQLGVDYRRTNEDESDQIAYGVTGTWTPNPDVTVFGSLEQGSKLVDDERRQRDYQVLAVAYRPVSRHWLDFVAMYRRENVQDHSERRLLSMDGVLHAFTPYTLSFNWIRRDQTTNGAVSVTDFKQVGLTVPLGARWDVGAQYRFIVQTDTENHQSLSIEVGYAVLEQLRVSAGYNFQAYDVPSFHGDQYNKPGVNVGVQLIF